MIGASAGAAAATELGLGAASLGYLGQEAYRYFFPPPPPVPVLPPITLP